MKKLLLIALFSGLSLSAAAQSLPTWVLEVKDKAQEEEIAKEENKPKYGCNKRYCKQMESCEEAEHYLNECGKTRLDRDKDGIPCEAICGN